MVKTGRKLIVFLLALLFAACGGGEKSDEKADRVTASLAVDTATVEFQPAGNDTWTAVAETQLVASGDSVRTDSTGAAVLTFFAGTQASIGPVSTLIVTSYEQDSSGNTTLQLNQLAGDARYQVAQLADTESRVEVSTPVAHMTVRGTDFNVSVAPDGATTVQVFDGIVRAEVETPSGPAEYDITAGQQLDVTASQTVPSTPYPIPAIQPPASAPTPTNVPQRDTRPTPTATITPTGVVTDTPESDATEIPAIRIGGTATPSK